METKFVHKIANLNVWLQSASWNTTHLEKNVADSLTAREKGNRLYIQKDHTEEDHFKILELYSQSVALAPMGSLELSLALGNRSAFLQHVNKYTECIKDINEALKLPILIINRIKYMIRKVECLSILGSEEILQLNSELRILLENPDVSKDLKKNTLARLQKALNSILEKPIPSTNSTDIEFYPQKSNYCLSESVKLAYSAEYKYHLKAMKDIPPGEILSAIEPYAILPFCGNIYTHCSHCYKFTSTSIPCEYCAYAVYCSDDCKQSSWANYHEIECPLINKIWMPDKNLKSLRLLATRILIMGLNEVKSIDNLREVIQDIKKHTNLRTKGFSSGHTTYRYNFQSMYCMPGDHTLISDKDMDELYRDSAVITYLLAKHSPFFGKSLSYDEKSLASNTDVLFIGLLLIHIQSIIHLNAKIITPLYSSSLCIPKDKTIKENNSTAIAICPILGHINYVCDPNISTIFGRDGKLILFSVQPIKKGFQLFECPGIPYYGNCNSVRDLRERECTHIFCRTCKESWSAPELCDIAKFLQNTYNGEDRLLVNKYIDVMQALQEGKVCHFDANVIKDISKTLQIVYNNVKPPHIMIFNIVDLLKTSFNAVYAFIIDMPNKC